MKKDTFNYSVTRELQATEEVIPVNVKRAGEFICIQVMACTDETTSPTRIDFGYVRGPSFVPLKSHLAPAIGFTVPFEVTLFMIIDDLPAVRVVGGVIGDNVQVAVSGYVLYKDESGE